MPGCVFFGVRLFSECCALEKVGIITENSCRLANGAVIAPYAFESCAKLSQLALPHVCAMTDIVTPTSPPAGISNGCFHSSGIWEVVLEDEAVFLGHGAYENCKQLTQVDISKTKNDLLHMHTFSHCQSLQRVTLPPGLREIRAEAFVGCIALSSLTLPSQRRYIGHRAFGGCSKLACLTYRRSKKTTWRRPYAACNSIVNWISSPAKVIRMRCSTSDLSSLTGELHRDMMSSTIARIHRPIVGLSLKAQAV